MSLSGKLRIFNTLTREVEEFQPIEAGKVGIYTCGPTVYNYAHIGNLRTYVCEDLIRRAFEWAGYQVTHVMNVTDVGHLESNADSGEDKMELAARKTRKSPWEIARFYENAFFEDCGRLGIARPAVVCRATEHIDDMIAFIQRIEANGCAYSHDGNVYFSIDDFAEYGRMARLDLANLRAGSRVEVDARKKSPLDFVLWFSNSKFPNQIMQWDSPWGRGFPGWHIECSAMATRYLGERIDVHMGGIDHIPVHHTNEIAQSECCLEHKWVNYWMHCDFLLMKKDKMSKSTEDFVRLATLEEQGYDGLHYRYFCFGAHYRSTLAFTWEGLEAARQTVESLRNRVIAWKIESKLKKPATAAEEGRKNEFLTRFWRHIQDDINVPAALGVVWEMVRDATLPPALKLSAMIEADQVLGLGVAEFERPALEPAVEGLIKERQAARQSRDWSQSDSIRDHLLKEHNIQLMDTPAGTEWYFLPKDEQAIQAALLRCTEA
jgi:cysteinyl-tRNA synthetase